MSASFRGFPERTLQEKEHIWFRFAGGAALAIVPRSQHITLCGKAKHEMFRGRRSIASIVEAAPVDGRWRRQMNESDIAFLLLASIAVLIVVFAIVRWITTRKEEKENIAASERWDQAQLQSHDQAEASYRAAKTALQGRPGGPMVVDLINDISDDWDSGGAPFRIEYGSATRILDQIKAARESQPIDIVIHTLGGYSLAAELIAAALKARPRTAPTRAYIPYVAMSGGTMVALAADTIYMGKNAALGPIDSLYAGFSGTSYAKLLQTKPADKIDDRTFLLAFEVEKYERDANRKACEIIDDAHKPNGATDCRVVHALMSASRPHSQRIPYSEAKALEMNVEEGCPDEVYALVDARLQMIRTYGQRAQQVGRR